MRVSLRFHNAFTDESHTFYLPDVVIVAEAIYSRNRKVAFFNTSVGAWELAAGFSADSTVYTAIRILPAENCPADSFSDQTKE